MKYAIIKCSNGSFAVESEWSDLTKAKVNYHAVCQTLWNAPDVVSAKVLLVDEQFICIDDCHEYIHHETEAEATE